MVGIIDIGSNTIRLVTYENGKKIDNISFTSEILKDTSNKKLTKKGTQKLCAAIKALCERAGDIDVYAIATFAFRELENRQEVKEKIFEETGVSVEILSGKDEAECDFYALKKEIGSVSGAGVDLGGGSAQIFSFESGKLDFHESYPIGCKKIKNKMVSGTFPTPDEEKKIERYIKKELCGIEIKAEKLYMMGGTAKTAAKMCAFLKGEAEATTIDVGSLRDLIGFIEETKEDVMKNVLRARYDNIVVGIIIMESIAKKCGVDTIFIKGCSVRDGYMIKKNIM